MAGLGREGGDCGRRMVQEVRGEPADFPTEADKMARLLEGPLGTLQERLAANQVFSGFLREHLGRGSEALLACSAPSFLAAAAKFIRVQMGEVQARLAQGGERGDDREALVGLLALGVLYVGLCHDECPPDPKTLRCLVDVHLQVPASLQVHLS